MVNFFEILCEKCGIKEHSSGIFKKGVESWHVTTVRNSFLKGK